MAISTDTVEDINIQSPQHWDMHFIRRFMLTFGLLKFRVRLHYFWNLTVASASKRKVFQTVWFIESVISAILIVLLVRTRLPFFKSLPGKYLWAVTAFILILVLALPVTPLASLFGLIKIPVTLYEWMLLVVMCYVIAAKLAKRWFYRKLNKVTA